MDSFEEWVSVNTIQSLWETFEAGRIPPEASAFQRIEMRKALFAGVAGILALQQENQRRVDGGAMSEEAYQRIFENWCLEIEAFTRVLASSQRDVQKAGLPTE